MTFAGWSMITLFSLIIVALVKPAGNGMHAIYGRENMPLGVIERVLYKLAGSTPRPNKTRSVIRLR